MRVLVTGHQGYIGTVMVSMLKNLGYFVIGVDNATCNNNVVIDQSIFANCSDDIVLEEVLSKDITHIFHLAASTSVPESAIDPGAYYFNNVGETVKLLTKLHDAGWSGKFIFSSTAAVYGDSTGPAIETQEKRPCNPYGHSKLMCEQVIKDVCEVANIDAVVFRYFNVAGAYGAGGDHLDSGHIIPKICESILNKTKFVINGDTYPTRDGTCVRDYVHVLDICKAHLHACEYLEDNKGVHTFNLGSRVGFSNKEIVKAFELYTGEQVEWTVAGKRDGDPASLLADNSKFIEETGFVYKHTSLHEIVTSAWGWHKQAKLLAHK
jgi:UDP-glucose 4-epimerase